jgi:hypothetical protein
MDNSKTKTLLEQFKNPPAGYGTVLFYWWAGEKLTKERIAWQLEQLKEHSIAAIQINYPHSDVGGRQYGLPYESEPPIFSDEWWELVTWLTDECSKYNIKVSLSDYTLSGPGQGFYTDEIRRENPDTAGQRLIKKQYSIKEYEDRKKEVEVNKILIMRQLDSVVETIEIYTEPYSINPMHPKAGALVCEKFFDKFEKRTGKKGGEAFDFFFSDELDFGIEGNLWSDEFQDEFKKRKGYDITPVLFSLFEEEGNFEQIREDYHDVLIQLEEENYFQKIYQWNESRNMTYGCDHGSRGYDATEFGDYFRTQKYNQGPGCDQPNLQSDIIKNKVASSISHLYNRKRVWLEGFYGSGWGTTTEQLTDAIARNFVMGHNLLALHGCYYSTYGGWWEWAPPCNCFHMPYWDDMKVLLKAVERLSFLLSQGHHKCDVAIYYPTEEKVCGYGEEAIHLTFEAVEHLYCSGIDVDFINEECILNSKIKDGKLVVGQEMYKMIILPECRRKAEKLHLKLNALTKQGGHVLCITDTVNLGELVREQIESDFKTEETGEDIYVNHRIVGEVHLYQVYGVPEGQTCFFAVQGYPYLMDAKNGIYKKIVEYDRTEKGISFCLPEEMDKLSVLAFLPEELEAEIVVKRKKVAEISLERIWDFMVAPNLDNQFGDFHIPAKKELVGPQIRTLQGEGEMVAYSYGAYMKVAGPFRTVLEYERAVADGIDGFWSHYSDYEFSWHYHRLGETGHQGYHGLKGKICDDFLEIGVLEKTLTGDRYVERGSKFGRVFFSCVYAEKAEQAYWITGEMLPDCLYLNGKEVTELDKPVQLVKGKNRVTVGYRKAGRTHLLLAKKLKVEAGKPLAMRWYENEDIYRWSLGEENRKEHYTFIAPPGLQTMKVRTKAEITVLAESGVCKVTPFQNDWKLVTLENVEAKKQKIAIFAQNLKGENKGAVFMEPIALQCAQGKIEAVSWDTIDGLRCYSGKAIYQQQVEIEKVITDYCYRLELTEVISTVSVYVNEQFVETKIAPPWHIEIGAYLKVGTNTIRLEVCNTLANQYETIPTRYQGSTKSGLIGKSSIQIYSLR